MVGYNGYEYLSFKRAENTATHNYLLHNSFVKEMEDI